MIKGCELLNFSLIVCTYQRAKSLERLLDSVKAQSHYPNEIIIVDGSEDFLTKEVVEKGSFDNLEYFQVKDEHRGLTKQRNYGLNKVANRSEIVCFLDDDIVLKNDYFENLISTYDKYPEAIAIGGWIIDEIDWKEIPVGTTTNFDEFTFDGYVRKLGSRNVLRKRLGLLSNKPPGYMPDFSHGFSTGYLPPSGKIYPVEFFMGGVSSYRKELFDKISFSSYFEGYGLYEDMDFCLRASRIGQLYVNTSARCYHYHEIGGRPDYFKYGKMVVRNGYYVWKLKNLKPDIASIIKWNLITFLLLVVRLKNDILDGEHGAKEDARGRFIAWICVAFKRL